MILFEQKNLWKGEGGSLHSSRKNLKYKRSSPFKFRTFC